MLASKAVTRDRASLTLLFARSGHYYRPDYQTQPGRRAVVNALIWLLVPLVFGIESPATDTLVVCPGEFRPALVEWEKFRRGQGHQLEVVDVPASAEALKATIRKANSAGSLQYVVIIGDAPSAGDSREVATRSRVPTNYVPAKINVRWGPEKEIASDTPYGDVDGDGTPDVAVGRVPARSPAQLAAVCRKIIRYEQATDHGPWEKCLNIVSGSGGFGAVADSMIQAAGKQVIQQTVPRDYEVHHIFNVATSAEQSNQVDFVTRARRELAGGSLAWVYVGHGLPTQLVYAANEQGFKSLLSSSDVPDLNCGPHPPLAVLVACYTGAMDAPRGCLAEELLRAEEGPVAVIAATRVTMPYGNTTMACELLRACFRDRPTTLGDVMRLAQQRVLATLTKEQLEKDQLRATLDGMAQLLSPPPADLPGERREHVLMYQLIGDPLLRLHRPAAEVAQEGPTTTRVR